MDKIYKLTDTQGNPRYVGYTTLPLEERLKYHLSESLRHKKTRKQRWIRRMIRQGELPSIELVVTVPEGPNSWQYWETHYIKLYRDLGYNLTNGTDGGDGVTMDEPMKKKISRALQGRKITKAHRTKLSKALEGRTGKLNPSSKPLIAYKDGEELYFHGAQEAERYFRGKGLKIGHRNIGQCLRGDRIQGGKYQRDSVLGYKFRRPTNGDKRKDW